MLTNAAGLWEIPLPPHTEKRISQIFATHRTTPVFFRADDIGGAQDHLFFLLMERFHAHRVPLCLAVVPTWITPAVWASYLRFEPHSRQWCWHQHGFAHVNHEPHGKKAEFGGGRDALAIGRDIDAGNQRLQAILGADFYPVFTPPWNRCGQATLHHLRVEAFMAVSRSSGAEPAPPSALPDIPVNVDLHTRKEKTPEQGWEGLYAELERGAAAGLIGIMLHHRVMNHHGFAFLDLLLAQIRHHSIPVVTYRDLLQERKTDYTSRSGM